MAVTDARNWPGTLEIGEFSARWRGAVGDSVTHSHFAAQAVFAAPSASVEHAGTVVETPALLIEPNVPHRLGPCALADLYFVEPTRHAVLPELVAAISAGPYRLVSQPSGIAFWDGENVTEAAHGGGFSDAAHFARTIKHMFGVNASQLFAA